MTPKKPIVRRCLLIGLAAISAMPTLQAANLESPKDRPILTVSGKIGATNSGKTAAFDMAMIEKLPQQSFTTRTPWDNHPVKFSGPLLSDVLAAVRSSGSTIRAVALNDYRITIPVDDARQFRVLMATRMNDQPIPVRTKGPLFIVYPFDSRPELQSNRYYERSIWQLKAIEIE